MYSGELPKNKKFKVFKNLKFKVLTGLLWLTISVIRNVEAEGQKGKASLGNLDRETILKNK